MNRKISAGLLIICFAIMTLWDIYPALTPEKGDTISEVVRDTAWVFYTLPYVCGVVMGHFFFNKEDHSTRNIPAIWGALLVFALRDGFQVCSFPGGNGVSLILGTISGAIWWPQAPGVHNGNPQE
ncbi:hypothetical protein OAF54_03490 [bacterium]|nr:hypothetical protein [bacterium]